MELSTTSRILSSSEALKPSQMNDELTEDTPPPPPPHHNHPLPLPLFAALALQALKALGTHPPISNLQLSTS